MPKIFEYLGIVIFFNAKEHDPIHVHAKYAEFESRAEFYLVNGIIEEIKIKTVKGIKPLTGPKLKDFKEFLEIYADNIVKKWVDYFIYHKDIDFERIQRLIK
ncbi:MAG: DUF4160 domain-containing protein [Candidatus Kapabacteria bacterium]|nr:DUF4160 domain-containing protein [Candidatus Kapabacteria bacterium]